MTSRNKAFSLCQISVALETRHKTILIRLIDLFQCKMMFLGV